MGSGTSSTKEKAKSALLGAKRGMDREEALRAQFQKWDVDKDKKIPIGQLADFLQEMLPQAKYSDLLTVADVNEDGEISFDELADWLFDTPYLSSYFNAWSNIEVQRSKEVYTLMKRFVDGKCTKDEFEAIMKDTMLKWDIQLSRQLPPLIEKSFDHHDKDGSGYLDKSESVVFFANFVSQLQPHLFHIAKAISSAKFEHVETYEDMYEDIYKLVQEYVADSENRLRKAFLAIDRDKSGKLERHEVVNALSHEMRVDKKRRFLNCLGLNWLPALHGTGYKKTPKWDDAEL
eukprot:TRINITY_DN24944_c0_g1_i2.p1 TRINITY_DN24944_c0_g1~~TRINITY_DN24944_c0_g1_i2.p1  ORF type:complete len:290 (+),score=69.27 TRINITY_DN24944_c0_g1_i2:46-915(+)